jgi:hypothetical protein
MSDFNPELLYEVSVDNGVAILSTDIMFNIGPKDATIVIKMLGSVSDGITPIITPISKYFGIKDRPTFKKWFTETLVRDDVQIVTLAHGNSITDSTKSKMLKVINTL